jgi:hypothetical protein
VFYEIGCSVDSERDIVAAMFLPLSVLPELIFQMLCYCLGL